MKSIVLMIVFVISVFSAPFAGGSKFLPKDKAFGIDTTLTNQNIVIHVKLAKDIHVYDEEFRFALKKPKIEDLTKFAIKPKPHKDAMGMMVYNKSLDIKIPLSKIDADEFTLEVSLMGCSDKGLCYPPVTKSFKLKKTKAPHDTKLHDSQLSEEGKIVQTLKTGSIWTIVGLFFGFGLLLSLTPCIFPIIPILSSIIVNSSKSGSISVKRGLFLSTVYILAMSVAYTIAGVIAGLFGAKFNIQAAMQNPYVLITFALIFVALAFSMFGFYEIQLPSSLQSKLSSKSNEAGDKGGVVGVAVMGFLSALIVGPCVAPALAGALVYIGQTGDALLGGIALFVMSLGMGMPLLLVGAGAGKFMPKPGGWMTKVSQTFGVVMLGLAIWMIDRIVSPTITLYLWGALALGSGWYLFKNSKSFFKLIALAIMIVGALQIIGAVTGASNPLKPLSNLSNKTKHTLDFQVIKNEDELNSIINQTNKPIMIDFSAKWCVSCKELEETTFKDDKIVKILKNFKLLRIDITNNTTQDKKFLERFEVVGPPALIFYKNKKELKSKKIVGYKEAKELLPILESVVK